MSDLTPVRTVLFGYGIGGRLFHAPFLRATAGFSPDAIVTANPERVAQATAETTAAVLTSAEEAWARADSFDLAVVSTGNATHVELALAALDRGLHVVVDKPLCADPDTATMLAERAAAADRLLVTFQNRRWDGDFLTLRRLVDEGRLGRLHRLESRFERWRPTPKGGWRESSAPADLGGLLYDLGSHVIDQALVLLGPVDTVYAEVGVRREGADVDDDTFVALQHASGAVSHHWVSALSAAPGPRFRAQGSSAAYIIADLDPQEDAVRADLTALPDSGSDLPWGLRAPEHDGLLYVDGVPERVATEPGDYRLFWQQLHAALTEGGPSPVPIEQTIELLRVLTAARESGTTGRTVRLDRS